MTISSAEMSQVLMPNSFHAGAPFNFSLLVTMVQKGWLVNIRMQAPLAN